MKKKILATIVLTLLLAVTASSQTPPNPGDQKSKEALKELFRQVRDWAQTNIIPRMKDWKITLDNSMTSDDLQALNKLRDRAAQIKVDGKKLAAALKKAWQNDNLANVKRYRRKIKELGEQREELLKDLKPLALEYKATLVEIGKEAKPYGKEWKEGIKKVVTDWHEKHKDDLSRAHKKAFAKGVARLKMLAGVDETLKAKIAVARFMLWDGKDLPEVGQLMDDESLNPDATMNQTPEGYSLDSNYPNPFNPSTKISFTIPEARYVSLVVYDALGREVATLVDSELGAGTHTASFDGRNLASGVYIYRIRVGDASTGSAQSFVQEKKMQLVK
ncbi:MAG: T9SS type A sorting domain-containing protein [Ignavibacteria bacterium]|nr:T9SS type A sorting domain-containing protein [Ignavibacteria bacterium]